jgi:predicted AAA+ superfamily ATPase
MIRHRKRYLSDIIEDDLSEKMVFLGGPRQVGKTTLAFDLLQISDPDHPAYLNWDNIQSRELILKGKLPTDQPRIIFDEIHKYLRWRNLIKGYWDQFKAKKQFLVTGSARLDYYLKGGDSLQGRYHYFRLHPFSLYELNAQPTDSDLKVLLEYGGFPEPLLKADLRHWKRWQIERATRVIQEDLFSLERVKEVSQLEVLQTILPPKVGSILSINSLREDLQVKHETAERWVSIFENLYQIFRISPYTVNHLRAVKKEKKVYLWDWSVVQNPGARFENLVASNLLKYCHYYYDTNGDPYELKFLRDTQGREIDFLVTDKNKPIFAVECKAGEKQLSPHIGYFRTRVDIPYFYQVHLGEKDYEVPEANARVIPFRKFVEILKV